MSLAFVAALFLLVSLAGCSSSEESPAPTKDVAAHVETTMAEVLPTILPIATSVSPTATADLLRETDGSTPIPTKPNALAIVEAAEDNLRKLSSYLVEEEVDGGSQGYSIQAFIHPPDSGIIVLNDWGAYHPYSNESLYVDGASYFRPIGFGAWFERPVQGSETWVQEFPFDLGKLRDAVTELTWQGVAVLDGVVAHRLTGVHTKRLEELLGFSEHLGTWWKDGDLRVEIWISRDDLLPLRLEWWSDDHLLFSAAHSEFNAAAEVHPPEKVLDLNYFDRLWYGFAVGGLREEDVALVLPLFPEKGKECIEAQIGSDLYQKALSGGDANIVVTMAVARCIPEVLTATNSFVYPSILSTLDTLDLSPLSISTEDITTGLVDCLTKSIGLESLFEVGGGAHGEPERTPSFAEKEAAEVCRSGGEPIVIQEATPTPLPDEPEDAHRDSFVIGVMESTSGPAEAFGTVLVQAKQMAVDEINATGGIDGRVLELVIEDSKCNHYDAVTAYEKLTGEAGVNVILGPTCSGALLGAAPLAEEDGVVILSAAASNPKVAHAGDYIFRTSLNDNQVGIETGNVLWADGIRRLATITEETSYAESVRQTTVAQFKKNGGTLVAEERYGSSATDFRAQLMRLIGAEPDALHMAPHSMFSAGIIVKQARELGYQGPIYAEQIAVNMTTLDIAGEAATGLKAIILELDPNNDKGQEVLANFTTRYGSVMIPRDVVSAYDSVYIVAECLSRTGDDQDADGIRDCLYGITWSGALGDGYSFDEYGEVVGLDYMVVEVLPVSERSAAKAGYRVLGPSTEFGSHRDAR